MIKITKSERELLKKLPYVSSYQSKTLTGKQKDIAERLVKRSLVNRDPECLPDDESAGYSRTVAGEEAIGIRAPWDGYGQGEW